MPGGCQPSCWARAAPPLPPASGGRPPPLHPHTHTHTHSLTHSPAHAFPGKRKQPQPPPPGSDQLKPLLYLRCPAAPSVALPHWTKGVSFYSAAAHAPVWKQESVSFRFAFCREVGLKPRAAQKILEDSAHSRGKKWRGGDMWERRGGPQDQERNKLSFHLGV